MHIRCTQGRPAGSALILTVVLTSLLAILAVLFIMTTRLDKMASSAASDNEQLGLAVETVVSQINDVLVNTVPGIPGNRSSYYVYPDVNNPWLADLEPRQSGTSYYWRQITNLTDPNHQSNFNNVTIKVMGERDPIDLSATQTTADADGDGVGDARWCRLPGVVTSKGKPVYYAVRVIDNSGMLNVNTGWTVPSNEPNFVIDGSSQLQINVAGAVGRSAANLQLERTNQADAGTPNGRLAYEQAIIWQYPPLLNNGPYTPFDISDELGLRYRFCLYHSGSDSRVEKWGNFNLSNMPSTPMEYPSDLGMWYRRVAGPKLGDPNFAKDVNDYAYRHVLTTYNVDRILTPKPILPDSGGVLNKRVNVNMANQDQIHAAILQAIEDRNPGDPSAETLANQITANLLDYVDDDNEVTVLAGPGSTSGAMYYGFERPCAYLSELAYSFKQDRTSLSESFAIEVYKPFFQDGNLPSDKWRIEVRYAGSTQTQAIAWSGTRRFHVMRLQNPLAPLSVLFQDPCEAAAAVRIGFRRNGSPAEQPLSMSLQGATMVSLQRLVGGNWLTVDYKAVPSGFASPSGDPNNLSSSNGSGTRCIQRDISDNKLILRLWSDPNLSVPNLGNATGNYVSKTSTVIQALPANRPLVNIGELGMICAVSAYGVSEGATPESVFVNLANPQFGALFNYLTVMDPARHGAPADETRIMGRININTASRAVLAQLPWIQYPGNNLTRAQAIVTRRDAVGAYKSIGDLMQVPEMLDLGSDKNDNLTISNLKGPDLTPDTARDDFEERDVLFTRLSDLTTVRSDVFTAYILVRIGLTGPQKRMVAILDRSQVSPSNLKARVIALYSVADSR